MQTVYLNDKQFSKPPIYRLDNRAHHRPMAITSKTIRLANVRDLIKELGGPTKAAAAMGMDKSQLSQIAGPNPVRGIGDAIARSIEKALRRPEGWLDVPHHQLPLQQNEADYNVSAGPNMAREVPLISWVQAGAWRDVVDNLQPGEAERMIPTTARVGPRAYALRVVGDSMTNPNGSPSFPDGTILIIDPERSAEPGRFVIVRQNSDTECTFKQLVRDSGRFFLKPLNPRYPILEMLPDAVICGVLAQATMEF